MIGSLRTVVLDCPDTRALAQFYLEVLGAEVVNDQEDWFVIADPSGRRIGFQPSPEYKPPVFPDPQASQQIHFDIQVDDVTVAEPQVLALGAKLIEANDKEWFRVYADPAGHIFCLVWFEN